MTPTAATTSGDSAVTPPSPYAVSAAPNTPLKPQPVAAPAAEKPLPQATIKLQQAPAPAASLKKAPPPSVTTPPLHKEADGNAPSAPQDTAQAEEIEEDETLEASGLLVPLTIAAAALAVAAFAVQLWTYLS